MKKNKSHLRTSKIHCNGTGQYSDEYICIYYELLMTLKLLFQMVCVAFRKASHPINTVSLLFMITFHTHSPPPHPFGLQCKLYIVHAVWFTPLVCLLVLYIYIIRIPKMSFRYCQYEIGSCFFSFFS